MKVRIRKQGYVPIEPAAGMAAVENTLGNNLLAPAVFATDEVNAFETMQLSGNGYLASSSRGPQVRLPSFIPCELSHFSNDGEFDQAIARVLSSTIQHNPVTADSPSMQRWLQPLRQQPKIQESHATVLADWRSALRDWAALESGNAAFIDLVAACVDGLPGILSGAVKATDVIFPKGSFELVQGIYQGNACTDYFNELTAEVVEALLVEWQDMSALPAKIIEIGAGTASTTRKVIDRIVNTETCEEGLNLDIGSYCFTDISRAFLVRAESEFEQHQFFRSQIFDVSKMPADQKVENDFDVAIATNILHATLDIRQSLRNLKGVLRQNGVLVINELANTNWFSHATFGLLEGWWVHRDGHLRLPHSPILNEQTWLDILAEEGFQAQTVSRSSDGGQMLIVAISDGVVRGLNLGGNLPGSGIATASEAVDPDRVIEPEPQVLTEKTVARVDLSVVEEPAGQQGANRVTLIDRVADCVAAVLRMPLAQLKPTENLGNYGVDSILMVQLSDALGQIDDRIDTALLYELTSVAQIAEFIAERFGPSVARLQTDYRTEQASTHPLERQKNTAEHTQDISKLFGANEQVVPAQASHDMAIIGMAGRFPGAADTAAFWELLREGRSAIAEIPVDRWKLDDFYESNPDEAVACGRSYSKWGGFVSGAHSFDYGHFNISPRDAKAMDPQERLLLEVAYHTFEDAGYVKETLADQYASQVGVFVGVTSVGFNLFGPELWRQGENTYPRTSFGSMANRVSYHFDLHGPSMSIDTLCSSSLVALHEAHTHLIAGSCKLALVCGVNVYSHPSKYVELCKQRMLSPRGRCSAFGADADGFVPGEAVVGVILKPLSAAERDRDQILGVLKGSVVNHDGRTLGYTVPNPGAQKDLITDALADAGVHANQISYVETHGTGTKLGDPIEIQGLRAAFDGDDAGVQTRPDSKSRCGLGSVKTNVGHSEAAAGLVSVIKVLLQMQNQTLVPSLNADKLSPTLNIENTLFDVVRNARPWELRQDQDKRLAGVSSFGAGGANAHVVLSEYVKPERVFNADVPTVVPISARSFEQLLELAKRTMQCFLRPDAEYALADIAYTLKVGREAFPHRLAIVAQSVQELASRLDFFLNDQRAAQGVHYHKLDTDEVEPGTDRAALSQDPYELAELWVNGKFSDWHGFTSNDGGMRVGLPGYVFLEKKLSLFKPGSQQGNLQKAQTGTVERNDSENDANNKERVLNALSELQNGSVKITDVIEMLDNP
ncbi:MAG: beta-ketoacyl synthase N-terminal-like domain-containing protein [Pseudomonadota bacterium]